MKDQGSRTSHGEFEEHQRCNLCNVPIFQNPCSDKRSSGELKGKGDVLCNKCAALLEKMPIEQAKQALDNAYETYVNIAARK